MAACRNCGEGSAYHWGLPGEPGGVFIENHPEITCPGFNFNNPTAGNSGGQPAPTKAEPTKEASK